jgi:hypothetical protein
MAAPQYVPTTPTDRVGYYDAPTHVPNGWTAHRPGEVEVRQPSGTRLGSPGPDQGYALKLVKEFHGKLHLTDGENAHDAESGCLAIAMKRSSMFGRAPVIHDLTLAFTLWGYLDADAPAELVELRKAKFEGVGHVAHHYAEQRAIVDPIPESTYRMTPKAVSLVLRNNWRSLLGLDV